MKKTAPPLHPLAHDARRDTMWVGKGAGPAWLLVAAIVAAAAGALLLLQ